MPVQALLSSFGLVFLTEIGDKTMLATLCLSAQYRRPHIVLFAAMLALGLSSVIAVVIGVVLATALPLDFILYLSGALFIGMGVHALIRNNLEADDCKQPATFLSMISLVLLSELGDKSQLAILALAAQSMFPLLVFTGAIAGFFVVNLVGAYAGDQAADRIPVNVVRKATGLVFIAFGILIILGFM
ncbi:MAG: TMEM165/GDT1 family protein [Candidatus Thorarchaeota archaeon]|jgi:putative Ca2+/H+ antiporter (TMEM165/GDT1 family)